MTDDRLRRALVGVEEPRRPDPDFAAALLEAIGAELGFESPTLSETSYRSVISRQARTIRRRRWPLELLLVAALVVATSIGLVAAAGAIRERLSTVHPPASLFAQLRASGRVRIAIRPDYPQYTVGGQPAAGFDADVARALGTRLGLATDLVIVDVATMLSSSGTRAWDIALPSTPVWSIDPSTFLASTPYYAWPHRLVVPAGSGATTLTDVGSGPICAVAGDAGESWLRGTYDGRQGSPIAARIVTRAADAECLAALASGQAIAAVTAHLSDADLAVRSDIRVIGGPAPEARAVILSRAPSGTDPTDLLRAIDDALAAMRADGTLARLSQSRFGGADLTAP